MKIETEVDMCVLTIKINLHLLYVKPDGTRYGFSADGWRKYKEEKTNQPNIKSHKTTDLST